MLEVFEKELQSILKGRDTALLHHLAHHMVRQGYKGLSVREIFYRLLSSGAKNTHVLAALVRCEWKSLKEHLPQVDSLNEPEQSMQLREMIERFNLLQKVLIDVGEELWQKKAMVNGELRVIKETRALWSKHRELTIYNLYDEMPVKTEISVSEWDDIHLVVQITPEMGRVFSADEEMQFAYIDTPVDNFRLKIRIDSVRSEKQVILKVVKVDTSAVSRRKQVRVGLEKSVAVQLLTGDEPLGKARLFEFSVSGFGLVADEELNIIPGEVIRCKTKIGQTEVDAEGEVSWVKSELEGGRFGLKMNFTKEIRRALQAEALKLQRIKAERLGRLGMPRTLKLTGKKG